MEHLVEVPFFDPRDPPVVCMGITVVFMDDPLHGVVVSHPPLVDVVAKEIGHQRRGNAERRSEKIGGNRVEPHEDRYTVCRPAL
jgi:hypothetical protein